MATPAKRNIGRLKRLESKPGSVVQRFGDWRQGEPQVIVDNQTWLHFGKPDEVEVDFKPKYEEKYSIFLT